MGSSIPYSVTKAAILHLTQDLAKTLAPKGIRSTASAPGTIENTRWNAGNPSFNRAEYESKAGAIPLRRLGEPEDIAHGIVFLASDAAGYITGINLPVEGGIYLG
jgi:NAD(P)-dependent dehydrogenase (short-subunit alcohol dehydrogenase family)